MRTDLGWRLDPAVTFLNHGNAGACPTDVLAAQQALREQMESEPVRFLTRELPARLDAAREAVAGFLRADPDGVPLDLAKGLLPWRTRLNFGLLSHLHLQIFDRIYKWRGRLKRLLSLPG